MAGVIENPPFRLWPDLTNAANIHDPYGQFVILSIDPAASVADLDDEQARQEATLLPRTRFLALVFSVGDIPRQNAERLFLLNLEFYLIGRGLPDEYPEETVPVFPATDHPTQRAAVVLSPPLPWTDLYIHTRRNFCALVSRIHPGAVACPTLASEAMRKDLMQNTWDDLQYRPRPSLRPRVVHVPEAQDDSDVSSSQSLDSGASEDDSIQKAYRLITTKAALVEKHVEIWMDLASCSEPDSLGTPPEFFSIVDQLQGVWERWESRALAALQDNRSETSAWACDVAIATRENKDQCAVETEALLAGDAQVVHLDSTVPDRRNELTTSPLPTTQLTPRRKSGKLFLGVAVKRLSRTLASRIRRMMSKNVA